MSLNQFSYLTWCQDFGTVVKAAKMTTHVDGSIRRIIEVFKHSEPTEPVSILIVLLRNMTVGQWVVSYGPGSFVILDARELLFAYNERANRV